MGRKSRHETIAPGHPNHLVTRGNDRRRLFSYPHERLTFLRLLATNLGRTECLLHAICLMTNHVHLLAMPPSVEAASKLLRLTLHRDAQIRKGARYGSRKLFEGPLYSAPIRTIAQLAATQMYIESNPLRAGITDDPGDYPWSSYGLFAGERSAERFLAARQVGFDLPLRRVLSFWLRSAGDPRSWTLGAWAVRPGR
jgi:putative transposase